MIRTLAICAFCVVLGTAASAFDLRLPSGAREISERTSPLDSYALPQGVFTSGAVPEQMFEGRIERRTWRVSTPGLTTLQVLAPLRRQVEARDYQILFECSERECGGFDFRFAVEVVPAPDMYVDIRDYRFLAATGPGGEALSLLVSRSLNAVYLQMIHIEPVADETVVEEAQPPENIAEPETPAEPVVADTSLAEELMAEGHVILSDLAFRSGATRLTNGDYQSLADLAAHLQANPGLRVALVGHTDSVGSLEQNIALSKRRAESVKAKLLDAFDIAPDRVEAEGMGYLSPIASNLTREGREANRRGEVILLSNG
ncbi:MAG: OmpA family protein [Arenibacterium sp.]